MFVEIPPDHDNAVEDAQLDGWVGEALGGEVTWVHFAGDFDSYSKQGAKSPARK